VFTAHDRIIYSGILVAFENQIRKGMMKRAVRCTKAPACPGSGKGSHRFGVLYAALPCILHKRLFPGVTFSITRQQLTVAPRQMMKINDNYYIL